MNMLHKSWPLAVMIVVLTFLASGFLGGFADMASARSGHDPNARAPGQETQVTAPRLEIQLQAGLLSVRIRNAPWKDVLKELERQTGITIRVQGPLAGTVSQEFEALPLEQGLQRLFRDANTLFLHAKGQGAAAGTLMQVWLLPRASNTTEDTQIRRPPTEAAAAEKQQELDSWMQTGEAPPSETGAKPKGELGTEDHQDERLTALHTLAEQGNVQALQQAVFDPDQTVQAMALELLDELDRQGVVDVLVSATKSDQPAMRVQALYLLHQTVQADDGTVLSAFEEALADAEVTVKSYAIQALAERGGPHAMESLRQALRDPDVAIRKMVIESVAQREHGRSLLQDALLDADTTIRSLAAFWLQQAIAERQ